MEQTGQHRLIPTLRDDLVQADFLSNFRKESREIEEFFLSESERDQLQRKGQIWRWFVLAWWVLKNSLLRLSSFRRILLVAGLVFIFSPIQVQSQSGEVSIHTTALGGFFFLLVLILELKDKLLARHELESGRAVQRAMNPETSPSVPGWNLWLFTRSANEVGGDLVDFLKLGADRYGVAIGDVAGKGLGAALFMVKIQSTLRALAPDFESLDQLAVKVNAILLRDGMPGKFASLLFARLSSSSELIQIFNAGHMPPLVLSSKGIEELPKGNAALGLSAETRFDTREVRVGHGECLVVYSDGVTDARNEAGEFFGLERLKTHCLAQRGTTPQSLGESVLRAITAFQGEARTTDDLSLVILQRAG